MFGFDRAGDSQTLGYLWCAVEGREKSRGGAHDATINEEVIEAFVSLMMV
jgi:hypothetical protein